MRDNDSLVADVASEQHVAVARKVLTLAHIPVRVAHLTPDDIAVAALGMKECAIDF